MDILKIKEMIEQGFAAKRIATILCCDEAQIREIIKENNFSLIKEIFSEDKIPSIIELYKLGVSAKSLGIKFSIDKRRVQKWVNQKGILRSQNESHKFTYFNEHIFDIIDAPIKAYWLGFFYADAYNSDINNTFKISLSADDYDHLIKLANFVELPISKIKTYDAILNDKKYPSCSLHMYSKHLCAKMTELGCMRAKSLKITFPKWLNVNLYSHFIRGMFDGDGCLTFRKKQKEWKWSLVSTKECCESIQKIILQETGLFISLEYISKTNNDTYSLSTSGNEKIKFIMDWLYKDINQSIILDRKYLKYLELIKQQKNRKCGDIKYNISSSEIKEIIIDLQHGEKTKNIANKFKRHTKTILKIKNELH